MNTPQQTYVNSKYLDVTQFVLTEHNPDDSSSEESHQATIQIVVESNTPGSYPIEFDCSNISPLLKGLYKGEPPTQLELTLEFVDELPKKRRRKRKNTIVHWMPITEELGGIVQQKSDEVESEQESEEESEESEESSEEESESCSPDPMPHSSRMDTMNFDFQTAEQSKLQEKLEQEEFKQRITQLIDNGEIKDIVEYLREFLTEDEIVSLSPVTQRIEDVISMVNGKLRRVGRLSVLERKFRVERYLFKRKNRIWGKKISYDCRKRVADARLRIKGRFITRKQAAKMLGMDVSHLSQNEIKELLDQKLNRKEIGEAAFNQLFKL